MNALLTNVTIGALRSNLAQAEGSLEASNLLVQERVHALSTAKRAAAADPCDFNKARVQEAAQELEEARKDQTSVKADVRRAGEALRVFAYRAKPAITGNGRAMRH